MSGKDHRNDRPVVGDVEPGVCETFMVRDRSGSRKVCEPGDLVEQSYDQSVERADGASGDVVWAVVSLFADESEGLVEFMGDDAFYETLTDLVDKLVGNV
jgi:hypothetical protein